MSSNLIITVAFYHSVHWKLILNAYLDAGWLLEDEGHIFHLPLDDQGDYNWQFTPASEWETVETVLETMYTTGQEIGLSVYNQMANQKLTLRMPDAATLIIDTQALPLHIYPFWKPDFEACFSFAQPIYQKELVSIEAIKINCVR